MGGWGEMINKYIDTNKIEIRNYAEGVKKLESSTAGINGKSEFVKQIADAIYESLTTYVEASDMFKGRLDDIVELYTLVQPIEEKDKIEVDKNPSIHLDINNQPSLDLGESIDNGNDNVTRDNKEDTLENKYDNSPKTGNEVTGIIICMIGITISIAYINSSRKKLV